jgi:hypothetical protein
MLGEVDCCNTRAAWFQIAPLLPVGVIMLVATNCPFTLCTASANCSSVGVHIHSAVQNYLQIGKDET